MATPIWKPTHVQDRIEKAAYQGGMLYVQMRDGRRFGFANVEQTGFDRLMQSKNPDRVLLRQVEKLSNATWTGQRCDNSPCQSEAILRGQAAGIRFHLCAACGKTDRYSAVELETIDQPSKGYANGKSGTAN